MANKKPDAKRRSSPLEDEAFLKEMRLFREKAIDYGFKWPTRSGIRYTCDAMIAGIDELGFVMTGQRRPFAISSHALGNRSAKRQSSEDAP